MKVLGFLLSSSFSSGDRIWSRWVWMHCTNAISPIQFIPSIPFIHSVSRFHFPTTKEINSPVAYGSISPASSTLHFLRIPFLHLNSLSPAFPKIWQLDQSHGLRTKYIFDCFWLRCESRLGVWCCTPWRRLRGGVRWHGWVVSIIWVWGIRKGLDQKKMNELSFLWCGCVAVVVAVRMQGPAQSSRNTRSFRYYSYITVQSQYILPSKHWMKLKMTREL